MEIKGFIESMIDALGEMDLETIEPLNFLHFHPLFAKEWIKKMEKVILEAEEKKVSTEQIAKGVIGNSHLRAQLYFILMDLKVAKIKKEKRKKISEFFYSILKLKSHRDTDGKESNIAHTKEDIKNILKKPFKDADKDIARALGRLYSSAYHLTNGLYTDFYTDYGVENYGPYKIDNNHILVIKHFRDLRPKELWDINSPYKEIKIYCIYKNIRFKTDAISVHTYYDGNTIESLSKYLVEADGKVLSLEEIKDLNKNLEELSAEQWESLISLSKEEIKIKAAYIRHYTMRSLFDQFDINWKPGIDTIITLKNKTLKNIWKSEKKEYWEKVLDPDLEFYG